MLNVVQTLLPFNLSNLVFVIIILFLLTLWEIVKCEMYQ